MEQRGVWRREYFFCGVVGAGLIGSVLVAHFLRKSEEGAARARFERRAVEYSLAIEHRLAEDVSAVESTAALLTASPAISRQEFRSATAHLFARHPSLQALSWNPIVRGGERAKYEARLRADGCAGCRITERSPAGQLVEAATRGRYTVVHYIEPYASNRAAQGYDVGSEPHRRRALERAAATGELTFTAKISLVQERESPGFLVFQPVYRRSAPLISDPLMQLPLEGFAVGVFQISDVVDAAMFDPDEAGVAVRIADATIADETVTLYSTHGDRTTRWSDAPLRHEVKLNQGGRLWRMEFVPSRPVEGSAVPWVAMLTGLLMTGCMAVYLRSIARANDGLAREIDRRRQAEEARRRLDAKLQESQRLESLGVLAGGIAHDFNNLLTGILGHAELALQELPSESPAREDVDQMRLAATRAADLTREILAYSGTRSVALQRFDLSQLVEEMAHLLDATVSKNADVCCEFPDEPVAIEGDPTQIRQIVMNLITNASDAIDGSPGRISVRTGTKAFDAAELAEATLDQTSGPGSYCFLEVADTGCGIQETQRARLFDPFFTTKFKGRGLGLAAVLGIVRSHSGAIWVHSETGRGTVFRLALPASDDAVRRTAPAPAEETTAEFATLGTVLIVDDEAYVRELTARMLRRLGLCVRGAADGAEAVETFRTHRREIGVVLLDATMPKMSGAESFRALREIDPEVTIVYSSGHTEEDSLVDLRGERPDAFLAKPYASDALVKALAEATRRNTPDRGRSRDVRSHAVAS